MPGRRRTGTSASSSRPQPATPTTLALRRAAPRSGPRLPRGRTSDVIGLTAFTHAGRPAGPALPTRLAAPRVRTTLRRTRSFEAAPTHKARQGFPGPLNPPRECSPLLQAHLRPRPARAPRCDRAARPTAPRTSHPSAYARSSSVRNAASPRPVASPPRRNQAAPQIRVAGPAGDLARLRLARRPRAQRRPETSHRRRTLRPRAGDFVGVTAPGFD